jgi:hypothetical protein
MSDQRGRRLVALAIGVSLGGAGKADARPEAGGWPPLPVQASRGLAGEARTALGAPAERGRALVVPYAGQAPDYAVHVLRGNPRWLYFEFAASEIAAEGRRFGVLEDPAIAAWMYTVPARGRVRLYVRLRTRTPVVAQILEPQGLIRVAAQVASPARPRIDAGRALPDPELAGPTAPQEPAEPSFPADPVVVPPGGEP